MVKSDSRPKLAVVLHADVVASTTLVQTDERVAHSRVRDAFSRFAETIVSYGGAPREIRGDALVAEFHRASDAVSAALAFQTANAEHNSRIQDDIRPVLRIGISLGEVVIADGTLTGKDVVIAQRLEQCAEPGGVCISAAVRQSVPNRLPFDYSDLGDQRLKGFSEPMRAFAVALQAGASNPDPDPAKRAKSLSRSGSRRLVAVLTGLLLLAGGTWWWQTQRQGVTSYPASSFSKAIDQRPSIAVLPFTNMSSDPEQEYFSDGITEDLITDLSNVSGLFVIARNSTFQYKGKSVAVQRVAEDLGVRYILEGSIRRAGENVRINAQLIDAKTGGHVWAQRYDHRLEDIFAVQDKITQKVVHSLELTLTNVDRSRRLAEARTDNVEAYDLVLKARKLLTRFDRKAATEARELLERVIELDPRYVEAHSLLGLYYFDAWRLWGEDRDRNLSRALDRARAAVQLNPADPAPHVLLAQIYHFRREFDAALKEADAALALGPTDSVTLANLGSMLRYAHRAEQAAEVVERAIRLDPYHPPNYLEWLGDAYFLLGRLTDCVETIERGIALDPDFVALHVVGAQCYAALGDEERAHAEASEILRTNPRFTLSAFASYVPFSNEEDMQRNVAMLRRAGLPE